MIILLLFLLIFSISINANHFNGGTITWAAIDSNSNSSSIGITITQSYSWSYPTMTCATNVPISTSGPGRDNANLTCIANCSTDGGYSNAPIDILTDCISYSSSLGVMTSERSTNTTLTIGAYFYIAYTGRAWRDLYDPSVNGLDWSIVTLIDLRLRNDGIINTAPMANVISPQYVIVNTTTLINIPVSDINEGDDVRCRWAINNVNLSIDECGGICYPRGLPNDTILSNCTLSFTGLISNTWYAIALQIEDFINETSTEPMSSVPVQFLIYVQPVPACTILPLILSLTDCLEVQVGVTMNFTLYAMNLCNSTVTITDIVISKDISGMIAGSLINSTTNKSLTYIPLTWTPQANQIGSQELCTIAFNNLFVQSLQYCVTFTVTTSTPDCPIITTTEESTTTTPNNDTNDINIPLIVGLSLLALMLTLCCCCCWLYYLLWSAGARRRREKHDKENIRLQKYPRILPLIITRNLPFKILNNSNSDHRITNNKHDKDTLRFSTPTSLSCLTNKQISIITTENKGNDQSFTKEMTKLPQNKVSTVTNIEKFNDNERKYRSNTITTNNSTNENIILENSNISIPHNELLNITKLNEDDTSTILKTRIIKVKPFITDQRQRSCSYGTSIDIQSNTAEHLPRMNSVSVTRVKRLNDNNQTIKSHEKFILPENKGEYSNNYVTVISAPQQKSKIIIDNIN